MPGLRIHHPSETSCVLVVPHPGDPTTGRLAKDYLIHLDADGNSIVSETVWGRLLEAERSGLSAHGFIVLNEVKDPPTLLVGEPPGGVAATPVMRVGPGGDVRHTDLEAVAQQFAPQGVRARIATKE